MLGIDSFFGVALAHDIGFIWDSDNKFWIRRGITFGEWEHLGKILGVETEIGFGFDEGVHGSFG